MALSQRQKLTIISLLSYWPTIFILTHRPVPQWVREAHVSDKSLHFLAYLILVFLLWFAIRPDRKVNWRRATVWWVLLVIVWYGVVDELLQGFVVGRSCDVRDFFANLTGVLSGLIVFTFLTFWPALLVVTGIVIFVSANLTQVNLADVLPATNVIVMFYLFAYGFFTILWIRHIHHFLSLKAPKLKWLIVALALPTGFLFAVKLFSVISDNNFALQDVILSAVGIAMVVGITYLTALFRRRFTQKLPRGNY
jgi:VanZ family protein